jgi:hypothetical protein
MNRASLPLDGRTRRMPVSGQAQTSRIPGTPFGWAAITLSLALLSCDVYPPSPNGTYRVATHATSDNDVHLGALGHGTLSGQVNSDFTACFWIGNDKTTALIWPAVVTDPETRSKVAIDLAGWLHGQGLAFGCL